MALNMVLVPSLYRRWINQKEYIPTAYEISLPVCGLVWKSHLSCNADNQKVCQLEGIVRYHAVLQSRNNSNGGIQRVAEEEVTCIDSAYAIRSAGITPTDKIQ